MKFSASFDGKTTFRRFVKFLEQAHELKAEVLVVEEVEKRVMVCQIRQALLLRGIPLSRHGWRAIAQFLLGEAKDFQHFVLFALVVGIEGFFEVMPDADVIDDKTLVLRRGRSHGSRGQSPGATRERR